jgi:hypothetical protein
MSPTVTVTRALAVHSSFPWCQTLAMAILVHPSRIKSMYVPILTAGAATANGQQNDYNETEPHQSSHVAEVYLSKFGSFAA